MPKTLNNSLFENDVPAFQKLKYDAAQFNFTYNGNNIIQDDIFHVIENYTRKQDTPFELLRYPIQDSELCACTFLRGDRIFVLINASLPLSKQIFAAAHELYHILRYFEGSNYELVSKGSILTSNIIDDVAVEREDKEANAFAGLLLASPNALHEQIGIYSIEVSKISISNILTLMDIFAIPYKAMVLRLYEEGYIIKEIACNLLEVAAEEISAEIEITSKSKRWQNIPANCNHYGSLWENMSINIRNESLTPSRLYSDQHRFDEIKAIYGQE